MIQGLLLAAMVGVSCVRARIDYTGYYPYVVYERSTPEARPWQLLGWAIGPNINHFHPIDFHDWTPVRVSSLPGLWGTTVVWSKPDGSDQVIRQEFLQECRMRVYLPLSFD